MKLDHASGDLLPSGPDAKPSPSKAAALHRLLSGAAHRRLAGEVHHWHHAHDRDAGNYANLSPVMDLLFGTYHHPGEEPEAFGLNVPIPRTFLGQLRHPFREGARSESRPL